MIIDCRGHYTTAPAAHTSWREAQQAAYRSGEQPPPYPKITDDEIRETVEGSQLRLMAERGIDLAVLLRADRLGRYGHHHLERCPDGATTDRGHVRDHRRHRPRQRMPRPCRPG